VQNCLSSHVEHHPLHHPFAGRADDHRWLTKRPRSVRPGQSAPRMDPPFDDRESAWGLRPVPPAASRDRHAQVEAQPVAATWTNW